MRAVPNKALEDLLMENETTAEKVIEKKTGDYRIYIQVAYPGRGEEKICYDIDVRTDAQITLDIAVSAIQALEPSIVYVTDYGIEVCTKEGWQDDNYSKGE